MRAADRRGRSLGPCPYRQRARLPRACSHGLQSRRVAATLGAGEASASGPGCGDGCKGGVSATALPGRGAGPSFRVCTLISLGLGRRTSHEPGLYRRLSSVPNRASLQPSKGLPRGAVLLSGCTCSRPQSGPPREGANEPPRADSVTNRPLIGLLGRVTAQIARQGREKHSARGPNCPSVLKRRTRRPSSRLVLESTLWFRCYGASCTFASLGPLKVNTAPTGRGAPGAAPVTVTFT